MDWRKGYTAHYYLSFVDIDTWRDTTKLNLTGGSIRTELTGLRTSADVDCVRYGETAERLIRIWLDADQIGSDDGHVALFTGYATYPDRKINGRMETETLQCYSVLLPASDVYLPRGWYAPIDINTGTLIKTLLRPTRTVVDIDEQINQNDAVLTRSVIAESGETNLSMVEKLLDIMAWRMWIDGMGVVHIAKYDKEPVAVFDSVLNDILKPELTVNYDWFNCPNVLRVIMDEQSAVAYDRNSETPMSIENRGREVWYEEENVNLNTGESLEEYAERRLKELQRVSTNISYTRRFNPDIFPTDIVRLNYPGQNVTGLFMVTSQSITLGFNAETSEEVVKV